MGNLNTLADRIEAGTVEMRRHLLETAYLALYPEPGKRRRGPDPDWQEWADRYNRFFAKAKAEAYVDAAMMLVPEGWPSVQLGTTDDGRAWASLARDDGQMMAEDPDEGYAGCDDAAAIALALAAAALRAHASEDTNV